MKYQIKILPLILTAFFLTACSSANLYHVQTSEEEFEYYQGKQVLSNESNGIITYLNYEHQDGEYFVFYSYLINGGNSRVTIDPSEIFVITNTDKNYQVLNPENEIKQIELTKKDVDNSYATSTGLNCLFGSFDVIASIADGNGSEAISDAAYWSEQIAIEDEEHDYKTAMLMEEKRFWQNETLRITTLSPDKTVGGLIYIKIDPAAKNFDVIFKCFDEPIVFSFNQTKK
jgi:hypothetical protein